MQKPKPEAARIPKPADPLGRREPLPWQCPKALQDDPQARQRVEAILASPSYRRADADLDFLARDSMRGVRLQMDFLKADTLLAEHNIRDTIVVFGSTRICEPAAAQRKVNELNAARAAEPQNKDIARRLAV